MNTRGGGAGDGDGAASEPILELAELAEEPSDGFAGRVQRSILRRGFSADLTDYVWFSPFRILLEYVGMVLSLLGGRPDTRRR